MNIEYDAQDRERDETLLERLAGREDYSRVNFGGYGAKYGAAMDRLIDEAVLQDETSLVLGEWIMGGVRSSGWAATWVQEARQEAAKRIEQRERGI